MKRFCLVITCVLVCTRCAYADSRISQNDAISIGKLRFGINDQELLLKQSGQQEQQLLDELARLHQEILAHHQKIAALTDKIDEQQRILQIKEQEMISLMRQNESLRNNLMKRLKAYYVMGRNGFFTIAFSGTPLPELLRSQDAFGSLVTYDQELFKEYRQSITEIKRVTEAKTLEKTMLEKFLADADQENTALKKTSAEKNELLKRVQAQKGLYQLALKEMHKAERELEAHLRNREQPSSPPLTGTFVDNKGLLQPPLWGEVVRRFHQPDTDDDPTFENGITIKTPANTEVYAVFSGTVLFAGPMLGYGNMVIIDHRQQYYSVSARLGQLRVRPKQTISPGQIIGATGKNSDRRGGEFYFEIRRDAVAEDPLTWLSPGSLALP
nr:peptidoglycan DD-metalloendopeptidase family protein [uncultured Desulfobulbus sp.]